MAFQGIIFDFNGVLLWDTHLQEAAWARFAQTLRATTFTPEEMLVHMHGRTNRYVLEYLTQQRLAPEEVATLAAAKEELYRELCLEQGSAFRLSPGATELLDWLQAEGIPHAIATASERTNVAFFTQHLSLGTWFDSQTIVFDDGHMPGKPAPDIYLRAAERLDLAPASCVVVEDARSGIAAAHTAGIGAIIALGPVETHDQLRSLPGVTMVISSLADVPRALLGAR